MGLAIIRRILFMSHSEWNPNRRKKDYSQDSVEESFQNQSLDDVNLMLPIGQISADSKGKAKKLITKQRKETEIPDNSDNLPENRRWTLLTWLKIFAKISIRVLVLALIIIAVWVTLTPYFRIDRNKDGDLMRNLPDNTIDVLALGSSHMQYAFNPGVFLAESGYYSYVFGSACQPFSESYYLLKEVLKNQSPEVVIVDVFTLLPQSQVCYADGTYYIAMDMMSGENRMDAANGLPDSMDRDTALGYTLDLYMNHGNWKKMDLSDTNKILANAKPEEGYFWGLGYVMQEPEILQYTPLEVLEPDGVTELSDNEKMWIDKFIDLCKEKQIHLMFIKTPYIENQSDANKLAGIWQYLDYKNVEYVDFLSRAEELQWFVDMDGDTWHNNTWGAEIVTKELAGIIREKGYVTRHKDNEEIHYVYDLAKQATAEYLMKDSNINIYRLLEEGKVYPCSVFFRYKGSYSTCIGEYENQAFQALGLNHDFIQDKNHDYYAVVVNGTVVQDGDEPFTTQVNGKTIELTESDILIDGKPVDSNGELQIVFADNEYRWVNPIGINYASSYFWKNGCDGWNCR